MKFSQGSLGRVFVLRLEDGDRIPDTIESFAAEHNLQRGFCALLGGLGPGRLVVGPVDGDASPVEAMLFDIDDIHEAAAVGTLFPDAEGQPKLHMHSALGRDGQTHTGCVRAGLDVWKIAEVVILEITGLAMTRRLNKATGFEILEEK
jgi:predicted DNA-binding protein with PD1-like motif